MLSLSTITTMTIQYSYTPQFSACYSNGVPWDSQLKPCKLLHLPSSTLCRQVVAEALNFELVLKFMHHLKLRFVIGVKYLMRIPISNNSDTSFGERVITLSVSRDIPLWERERVCPYPVSLKIRHGEEYSRLYLCCLPCYARPVRTVPYRHLQAPLGVLPR